MTARSCCHRVLSTVAALLALALAVIWLVPEWTRQYRVMATGAVAAILLAVALTWVLAAAPWRWRRKLAAIAAMLAAVAAPVALLRVEGVRGDLVPVLGWRWAKPPELARPSTRPRAAPAAADDPLDYPRFLGSAGDGIVRGVRLARDWRSHPPRVVWRRPVGAAWSAFAIAHGRAFTQESRGEDECVTCYDLTSGEPLWVYGYPARLQSDTTIGGDGPRATPTVTGGRVYSMGATGVLSCVDEHSGDRRWARDVVAENGARVPTWGKSCSPWVAGGRVIVSAGGKEGRSLVAYDAGTGEPAWAGGTSRSGFSSPFPAALDGVEQFIAFNADGITAHDGETGAVLWGHPWINEHPNVAQPIVAGEDRILVSSGYGVGAALLQARRDDTGAWRVVEVWRERSLKSKFANMIRSGGHVIGLDDGILACIRLADGKRLWKGGRYGHGQLLAIGDLLVVQAESGEVALVEASADGHRELGRVEPLTDKTWNHPAFRPPYLLVRNHKEAVCLELPLESAPPDRR